MKKYAIQSFVIPAQAGIQQYQNLRAANKTNILARDAGNFFDYLDSRLCGITSDLPACWLSRMDSSSINDAE